MPTSSLKSPKKYLGRHCCWKMPSRLLPQDKRAQALHVIATAPIKSIAFSSLITLQMQQPSFCKSADKTKHHHFYCTTDFKTHCELCQPSGSDNLLPFLWLLGGVRVPHILGYLHPASSWGGPGLAHLFPDKNWGPWPDPQQRAPLQMFAFGCGTWRPYCIPLVGLDLQGTGEQSNNSQIENKSSSWAEPTNS